MAPDLHHEYPVVKTTEPAPDVAIRKGRFLFHTLSAAAMINSFFGLTKIATDNAVEQQYGGFFQYLTIIGLMVSTVTMILSSLNDLLPNVNPGASLKRALMLFAMPVEIVIASIYWPLVLFSPQLMFPTNPSLASAPGEPSMKQEDVLFRIPLWMDLSMHALPTVVLLLDFFLNEKRYRSFSVRYGAPLLAATFGISYSLWVEHCATINGKFPYPFLTVMDFTSRVTMYISSTIGSLLTFWGLNWLHR